MKKTLLMFAALLMAVGSFTSCSKDDDDNNEKPKPDQIKYDSSNVFTSDYEVYGVGKEKQTLKINFKSSCVEELEIVNLFDWLDITIVQSNSSLFVSVPDYSGEYARSAEIIIQTNDKTHSKSIKIVQEGAKVFCTDNKHPHSIDLGTGIKWACCNVGASAPWEYGGYYAWGETKVKSTYYEDNYQYFEMDIGSDISGTSYDVAHVQWHQGWKMPSKSQFEDLIKQCVTEWDKVNGKEGRRFTSKNGMSIFLPAAACFMMDYDPNVSFDGKYFSSTKSESGKYHAYDMWFDDDDIQISKERRSHGCSVRPVTE